MLFTFPHAQRRIWKGPSSHFRLATSSLFPTEIGKNPGKLGNDDEAQVVAEKI